MRGRLAMIPALLTLVAAVACSSEPEATVDTDARPSVSASPTSPTDAEAPSAATEGVSPGSTTTERAGPPPSEGPDDTDDTDDASDGPTTSDAPRSTTSRPTTSTVATSAGGTTSTTSTTVTLAPDPSSERTFDVFVPSSYDAGTPAPLLVLLHGYTASGALQELYFRVQPLAEEHGFLYVHPDGTVDGAGNQFWNATDACCNFSGSEVDDVAYLTSVIEAVQAEYAVDPKRIFLAGHSNGGFMSYRLACERADLIAAVASLAGATLGDHADCTPSEPVSVLQIHGTADNVIFHGGGEIFGDPYPSAQRTVETWAELDGCAPEGVPTERQLDLDQDVVGTDTSVIEFTSCPTGIGVELWTIGDGSHVPRLTGEFTPALIEFLLAHPKS